MSLVRLHAGLRKSHVRMTEGHTTARMSVRLWWLQYCKTMTERNKLPMYPPADSAFSKAYARGKQKCLTTEAGWQYSLHTVHEGVKVA